MPRHHRANAASGHLVLVVDDDPAVRESSTRLLEAEGHRVLMAADGPTGIAVHRRERPHLLLLDYFMPGMTGEDVVRRIRETDPLVQIILTTGYAGERPARTMMRQLDIQGYHDKGDGAERLLLWVDSALKAYRHARAMERQRAGLEYIVHFAPDVHRLQRLDELLPGLLWQLQDLLHAGSVAADGREGGGGSPAGGSPASGFVALTVQPLEDPSSGLAIRAGRGRFFSGLLAESLEERERFATAEAIATRRILLRDGATVVPLCIGPRVLGVIYLEASPYEAPDRRLLEIFAAQAACAVQSALLYGEDPILYEMATRDHVTGLVLPGYWTQLAHQLLKSGRRRALPVSLLRVSLGGLDRIRARGGRERAIRTAVELVEDVLEDRGWTTRGEHGDLLVLLPDEPADRAEAMAQKIARRGASLLVELDSEVAEIQVETGVATHDPVEEDGAVGLLDPGDAEEVLEDLVRRAEESMGGAAVAARA